MYTYSLWNYSKTCC